MKLMDFATVNPDARRWDQGYNASGRSCAVDLHLADTCVPDPDVPVQITVIDGADIPTDYFVAPWTAEAILGPRSAFCEQPDDQKWLERALEASRELIFGRALVIQATTGADTWINGPGVNDVALAGSTAANWRTAVVDGRKEWFSKVVDPDVNGHPALHIPPSLVPLVKDAGVLKEVGENAQTIWDDPVVISEGYDRVSGTPNAFWSGSILLWHRQIEGLGPHRMAAQNSVQVQATELFAIDLNPCSIVRIGSYA